jgi:hypothetical protein
MGIIQRGADLIYTFRFIKLLVTKWENTDAYKLGIIDADGKPLRKASSLETSEEKSAYTLFHRLVYNVKRLVNKVPLVGKTTLASWAAALWLIKEETGMSEKSIVGLLEKYCKDNDISIDTKTLSESNNWLLESNGNLKSGSYQLVHDIASPITGEIIAKAGSNVLVKESTCPIGSILGSSIFYVEHIGTRKHIYISTEDVIR